jgi:hypothetical protein
VFGLVDVLTATATLGMETAGRIERIVERGHETSCAALPMRYAKSVPAPSSRDCPDDAVFPSDVGDYENS